MISGFSEMALEETDPEGELLEDLNEIHTAAQRAADITRQLLAFARKQTITPKVLALNESVENMPKMNGRDLAEQLQSICPDFNCIFMSGYTANVITRQGVLDKEVNFIQKPFSRRDLAEIVRKVLDKNV